MKVVKLDIENFRGIRNGSVRFKDHTVLIGPNNSSKTTIIEALALVLGRDRLVRNLTEHDFFGSTPEAPHRIKIIATVCGFAGGDASAYPDWFRDGRGVPVWFDPGNGAVAPEKNADRQLLACRIALCARFDREALEVETARYFYDDDDEIDVFAEEGHVAVPAKLIRDIGFFLIPASRSWDRMLSFGSELFRRVVRSAGGLPAETIIAERDRLRNPAPSLEADERLEPIVSEVNGEITRLFGRGTPLRLRLTSTDSEGVLEGLVPHFDTGQGGAIPSKRQGSGLISLQSLFLLLHFGQRRINEGESFCMALEEPELHLPPAVQRRVLSRLQSLSTQTIVTTHSPLVAAYCDPTSLLVVRNDGGMLEAKALLEQPLTQEASNAVRKLFQINRVETAAAVMSEIVLVPEGRYDCAWLELLLRVAELDQQAQAPCQFGTRIGVAPTSDAKVRETCDTLAKSHPRICALVDGDADGHRYADNLDEEDAGAGRVLLWPDGWTMEDVIGWILAADEAAVLGALNRDFDNGFAGRQDLVERLKSENRDQHGLKGDLVAYETIANAITGSVGCSARTKDLLNAISAACSGENTALFPIVPQRDNMIPRMVFAP